MFEGSALSLLTVLERCTRLFTNIYHSNTHTLAIRDVPDIEHALRGVRRSFCKHQYVFARRYGSVAMQFNDDF